MSNFPTYRYYAIESNGTETEVFPVNEVKFRYQRQEGQYYYRLTIDGSLEFQDRTGITDYTFLKSFETTVNYLNLRVEQNNGSNVYSSFLTSFIDLKGEWKVDQTKCTLGIKPNDVYTFIDKYGDIEFNILQSGLTQTTIDALISAVTYSYPKCVNIITALEYVYQNIAGVSGASITSQFFTSATNPITSAATETNNIFITPKTIVIDETDPNTETVLNVTFNGLMKALNNMYNVYFNIVGSTLFIEHFKYYDNALSYSVGKSVGLNLTSYTNNGKSFGSTLIDNKNQYTYDSSKLVNKEKYSYKEFENPAFAEALIEYDVNLTGDQTKEYALNEVVADVEYINGNTEINKDGICILITDGSDVIVRNITVQTNEFKSLSNVDFDTFLFTTNDILSAIDNSADNKSAKTNEVAFNAANTPEFDSFTVTFSFVLNSGSLPKIGMALTPLTEFTVLNQAAPQSFVFTNTVNDVDIVPLIITSQGDCQFEMSNITITRTINQNVVNAPAAWTDLLDKYWQHGRVLSQGIMNGIVTNFISTIKIKNETTIENIPVTSFDPANLVTTNIGNGEVLSALMNDSNKLETLELVQ